MTSSLSVHTHNGDVADLWVESSETSRFYLLDYFQGGGSGLGLIQHKPWIGLWFKLYNHSLTFDYCLIMKHEHTFIH